MHSSPAVANGIVYVGNIDGKLYALYANNGTQFWNRTTTAGQEVYSSPAVVNDVVYVGSNDQGLYAIGATNGSNPLESRNWRRGCYQALRWRMDLSISGASTAIYMP